MYASITWKTPAHSVAHNSSLFLSEIQNTKYQLLALQNKTFTAVKMCIFTLTASMMTECGVLAVKTKPSPLAPLTSAPSSGEEAW